MPLNSLTDPGEAWGGPEVCIRELRSTISHDDMDSNGSFDQSSGDSTLGFESIYEETGDDPAQIFNGTTLSDLRPSSPEEEQGVEMEETTIYVSEEADDPPELEDLNEAIEDGWRVKDISLGRRKSTQAYCFIVTLEREAPPSFFEVVAGVDPSSASES